ncbi:MAG: hypothetical protein GWM98_15650 [Nitrospinaceae bacterium]|nr:hypothetical protein [Nitrospinaceae bacterium]NIR55645.1 hypothetical protein [Nitrospinaceae bacterium]NIS86087.1 hypothetical protein [Nitrospinaceae bacterium]NIT82931.1 hypothetical protein [Nitrospinaceae bacterium]NIU45134.1 hypothetical protein [Nitrospinaceae bacterium]
MPYFRRVFLMVLMVLLASGQNLVAADKNNTDLFHDLTEYTKYLKHSTSVYNDLTEIFTYASAIDDLSQAVLLEEVREDQALKKKRRLAAAIESDFKSVGAKMKTIYQPDFRTKRFSSQVKEFNDYLMAYKRTIRQSIDDSYNLFEASLTKDLAVVNQFDLKSRKTIIRALEGENALLKLRMGQLEQNNPSFHLFKSIVHSNQSLIYVIKARISEMESPEVTGVANYVPESGASFVKIAGIELGVSRKAVENGKTALKQWENTNRYKFSFSQQFKDVFNSLVSSFDESFKVELQINRAFQVMLDEFPGDDSFEQINGQIDTLIDQRMNLQNERIRLVAHLSNLGKTMSRKR